MLSGAIRAVGEADVGFRAILRHPSSLATDSSPGRVPTPGASGERVELGSIDPPSG